jgi:hypothetical protein
MTQPDTAGGPVRALFDSEQPPPRWHRRAGARFAAGARAAGSRLAGPARMLPGVAAAGCAFAGSLLLWGLGVALLVAAGLLLLVDARTPGR